MSEVVVQTTKSEESSGTSGDGLAKISARDAGRKFVSGKSTVQAFGPIDLDIDDGEFVCIVGPSGCGKSTFLRIVAGLLPPSDGTWSAAGPSHPPTAMVFQDYASSRGRPSRPMCASVSTSPGVPK